MYNDLIGIKFKLHGRTKEEGFDCWGLLMEVLKRNGITVPDFYYNSLLHCEEVGTEIKQTVLATKLDKPDINSILEINVRGQPQHVAVYIGNGNIIHTMISTGVLIEPIRRYEKRIRGIYKVSNS